MFSFVLSQWYYCQASRLKTKNIGDNDRANKKYVHLKHHHFLEKHSQKWVSGTSVVVIIIFIGEVIKELFNLEINKSSSILEASDQFICFLWSRLFVMHGGQEIVWNSERTGMGFGVMDGRSWEAMERCNTGWIEERVRGLERVENQETWLMISDGRNYKGRHNSDWWGIHCGLLKGNKTTPLLERNGLYIIIAVYSPAQPSTHPPSHPFARPFLHLFAQSLRYIRILFW